MDNDPRSAADAARAALLYTSGDFDTSQQSLVLGRHAASESLLVALARYAGDPELTACASTREAFEEFERLARAANRKRDNFQWIPTRTPERGSIRTVRQHRRISPAENVADGSASVAGLALVVDCSDVVVARTGVRCG